MAERKFPLIVWEQTDEFKQIFEEAERKRQELVKRWRDKCCGDSYVGSVEPDKNEDGEPVFWINEFGSFHTGRFYGQRRNWSAEEALKNALKYGDGGWCNLDELEQLVEERGPLLDRAMHDCGFRPHKKFSNKWVRITHKYEKELSEGRKDFYQRKEKEKWMDIDGTELKRLDQLWVLPNEWVGLGKTYSIQVNNKGLIYVRLEFNPLYGGPAEGLSSYYRPLMSNRAHIAKEQKEFQIEARNVQLGKQKGIHIKANRPDESYTECIWPHQTPQEKIYDLADDLVSRINKA